MNGEYGLSSPIIAMNHDDDEEEKLKQNPDSLPMTCSKNNTRFRDHIPDLQINCKLLLNGVSFPSDDLVMDCHFMCTFNLKDMKIDPRIEIVCESRDLDWKILRTVIIEFTLGGSESQIQRWSSREKLSSTGILDLYNFEDTVVLTYSGCQISGTGNLTNLPETAVEMIKAIQAIPKGSTESPRHLTLLLYGSGRQARQTRDDIYNKLLFEHALNLEPYLNTINGVQRSQAEHLPTRQQVWNSMGGCIVNIPKRSAYRSCEEAAILQNNASDLEHKFFRARSNTFEAACHHVAFQQVNLVHGKAFVRADVDLLMQDFGKTKQAMFPMSTETFEITVTHPYDDSRTCSFQGTLSVAPDKTVESTFQLHIIVQSPLFRKLATRRDQPLRWLSATVRTMTDFEISRHPQTLDSNSVFWLYKQSRLLHNVACGQRLHEINIIDPTADLNLTNGHKQKILDRVRSSVAWSVEQQTIIDNAFTIPGGIGLISAPGGCGKTVVVAGLATIYQHAGLHCVATAKTHSATNSIYKKIASAAKEAGLPKPVRFYRVRDEIRWLMNQGRNSKTAASNLTSTGSTLSDAHKKDIKMLDRVMHADAKYRFDDPKSSVAQALLDQYILTTPPKTLMVRRRTHTQADKFTWQENFIHPADKRSNKTQRMKTPPVVPYIDGVAKYLELQKDCCNIVELRYYCTALLQQFIATQKVVVTTAGNSMNPVIQDGFARGTKGIVFFVDEVSQICEPEVNGIIANIIPWTRNMHEFGGKELIKAVWLSGDTYQLDPWLLNKQHNEFYEQHSCSYLSRLSELGHLTFPLTIQHRFHEAVLRNFINPVIYDNIMVPASGTDDESPGRKLTPKQTAFLRDYLQVSDDNDTHSADGEHDQKCDEICRVHFIDVKGSQEESTLSGSKINVPNISAYLQFIKAVFIREVVFSPCDWAWISPYVAQLQVCRQEVDNMIDDWNGTHGKDQQKTFDDVPAMLVGDSAQSREFKYVWYDITSSHTLGFLDEDKRVQTHLTRGRDIFWMVGSKGLGKPRQEYLSKVYEVCRPDRWAHCTLVRAMGTVIHGLGRSVEKVPPKLDGCVHMSEMKSFKHPNRLRGVT